MAFAFVPATVIFQSIKKKTPAFAWYFNHTNPGGVNAFWARSIQEL